MNILDRIASFLGGIVVLVVSIALLLLVSPYQYLLEYYWTSILQMVGIFELGLIGVIILLIAIRMFWLTFKREKRIKSVSKEMEFGELKIAVDAIESMVMQVANETRGIKDIKTKIRSGEDGIMIYFKGKVAPDVVIPQLSQKLQHEIKDHIESVSGITVKEVKMLIENITEGKRKKPSSQQAKTDMSDEVSEYQEEESHQYKTKENDLERKEETEATEKPEKDYDLKHEDEYDEMDRIKEVDEDEEEERKE